MKKMWEPFGSCLQNSTSNPAHFLPNWAGLAVLFSRKLPNDFFNIFKFFTYETNETHALAFLKHIILAIGGVIHYGDQCMLQYPNKILNTSIENIPKYHYQYGFPKITGPVSVFYRNT